MPTQKWTRWNYMISKHHKVLRLVMQLFFIIFKKCYSFHEVIFFRNMRGEHSWQRILNPPILRRPPILPTPLFQILPNPPPHYSPCCFVSLNEWLILPDFMCYSTWWYYGSTHVKPWHHSTRRTLLCVSCSKVSSILKSDTCGFSLIFWFDIMHTQRHAVHTEANRLTHPI